MQQASRPPDGPDGEPCDSVWAEKARSAGGYRRRERAASKSATAAWKSAYRRGFAFTPSSPAHLEQLHVSLSDFILHQLALVLQLPSNSALLTNLSLQLHFSPLINEYFGSNFQCTLHAAFIGQWSGNSATWKQFLHKTAQIACFGLGWAGFPSSLPTLPPLPFSAFSPFSPPSPTRVVNPESRLLMIQGGM